MIKRILKHFLFTFTHRFPSFTPSTLYSRIPSQSLVPPALRVLRGLVDPKEKMAETGETYVFLFNINMTTVNESKTLQIF